MKALKKIVNGNVPVLIEFHADWCGSCQTMKPIIHDIQEYYKESLLVLKINVDQNIRIADRYNIWSVPTLILFKEGKEIWKVAGLHSRADIKRAVDKIISV